ncbi:MAG TPA: hypothetical protein VNN10_00535 [Dehalococcoidia bacterium]|nr:hypothetical protein [Dehalococcoidia bacterium]
MLLHAVRDWLFRAFPPPPDTPDALTKAVIARLVAALADAVIGKLRRRYRRDTVRTEAALLRTYPGQAGALVEQACDHLLDCWIADCQRHPRASLVERAQRILPKLARLPNRRGRPILDGWSRLRYLVAHADARRWLTSLPRVSHYSGQRKIREDLIVRAFQRLAGRPPSPALLARWLDESRSRLACELACWSLPMAKVEPGRLRRLLPHLRRLARELDRALARSQVL